MKYVKLFVWLPVVFILISACSNKLTDSKAEKIIKNTLKFPIKEDIVLKHGIVEYNWPRLQDYYYRMQQAGLLKVEYLQHNEMFALFHFFRVTLTPEGKKYLLGEKEQPKLVGKSDTAFISLIQTNIIDFVKIESVREIPNDNSGEIKYVMRRSDFTPFWRCLPRNENPHADTLIHTTFRVIKTNNGWEPRER